MQKNGLLNLLHRKAWPLAGYLAVGIAIVEVVVDWITWIELNEAIVYTLPLILAGAARNRRLLWGLAVFLTVTSFGVYYVQIPPGVFSPTEPFFIDRVLAVVTLLVPAGLLHAWTLAIYAIEAQSRSIKQQNEQLLVANAELLQLRDEVMRQNDELDIRRQAAEDASTRKSQILASVSHDIRSPLNAINLMAEIIRSKAGDPVRAADVPGLAERLKANVLSVADLVTEVLDISSIDSGRIELHETVFSLDDLFEEEIDALVPLAENRELYLFAEPSESPIQLYTDRVKLARVIGNLITNAIKFTESGGVRLYARRESDGGAALSVSDTGIGISPADQERVFDEFSQIRTPASRGGWGLGLAICRRLIAAMGGSISVESEPGRGSTFRVRLPASCVRTYRHGDQF
jgi:signal transduction histidine kinase